MSFNKPILDRVFVGVESTIETKATITLEATGSASYGKEIELARPKNLFRKAFQVGPVPILVEIDVQPMFFLDATAEAEGTLTVVIDSVITAAMDTSFDLRSLAFDVDEDVSGNPFDISDIRLVGSFAANAVGRLGVRFIFSGKCFCRLWFNLEVH